MVRSMTGYGRYESLFDGRTISVEVKSVNHRYFEFSARVPRNYGFLEEKLKSFFQSKVSRGKVDVYVSIEVSQDSEAEIKINHLLAAGYVSALKELAVKYSICDDISVSTLSKYPDIFTIQRKEENEDELWENIKKVAQAAAETFVKMRENEGERLTKDVKERTKCILEMVKFIEERSPLVTAQYRERLEQSIKVLLEDRNVDEQRLLTETAIFADKIAVDEETVRLRSHITELTKQFEISDATGQKMDFIVQEMNREVNTIGSKIQDVEILRKVVDMKSEIEKIREQIQNIE